MFVVYKKRMQTYVVLCMNNTIAPKVLTLKIISFTLSIVDDVFFKINLKYFDQ